MSTVRDVLVALERVSPKRYAFSFDKVGLQVGDLNQPVMRAVVSLDRSRGAVAFAKDQSAQLLLSHHPLIFRPLESVDTRTHEGTTVVELIRADISFVAAHTNWDSAQGGVNDTLAQLLRLQDVKSFGQGSDVKRTKLAFFCPEKDASGILDAISEAGAGEIGAYRRCAFYSPGTGTFIGGPTSQPAIGTAGSQELVAELRVETILRDEFKGSVVRALVKAHPYEEPAYDLIPLAPSVEQPAGRVGRLAEPLTLRELATQVRDALQISPWTWGDPNKKIRKVAVVGGSADLDWVAADRAGADVLVTGEVKQHVGLEASESGFCLIAAGHYATEHPGCETLRQRMAQEMPDIDWVLYTPEEGLHGRPFMVD